MFERASIVELSQLAEVLDPPCTLGPYELTGALAQSATALLFTARGGPFGDEESVLKLTASHHAPRLQAELARLVRCADAGVGGVVRPLLRDPDWLPVPGLLDAHVAALAMPFLTGGDLYAFRRAGAHQLSPTRLAIEVAVVVASTLRHLLELSEPIAHGSLGMRSVVLPRPEADLSELKLVGFGAATDLVGCTRAEAAAACHDDVTAFGALLQELAGSRPGRQLAALIDDCRAGKYASLADPRLWRTLQRIEHAERSVGRSHWLSRVWVR